MNVESDGAYIFAISQVNETVKPQQSIKELCCTSISVSVQAMVML